MTSAHGSHHHLDALCSRLPALVSCRTDIEGAYGLLHRAFSAGGKVLLCGNGGSAADCEHWSGELIKGFRTNRRLSTDEASGLPAPLAGALQGGLPAIPIPSLISANTAFGNDVDPRFGFAQVVWALGRPGDVLVGISTSGKAENVCYAAQAARARGMAVLALTGETGGELKGLADVCIRVPAQSCDRAQELHLPVYHCLAEMLEATFFPHEDR